MNVRIAHCDADILFVAVYGRITMPMKTGLL